MIKFPAEKKIYGAHVAFQRMLKRDLRVLAYLILVGFTAYSFTQERKHSNENRRQLAVETRATLQQSIHASCERGNELRASLRDIILSGIPQTKKLAKEGTLTPVQAERSIALSQKAAERVRPIDCKKAASLESTR